MRDRTLTGPWAGFSFKGGRLVTPEGRELLPEDLAWLSLTAAIAQEWRAMMDDTRRGYEPKDRHGKPCGSSRSKGVRMATRTKSVVNLRDYVRRSYEKRSSVVDPGPGAAPTPAVQTDRGHASHVRG
ncbi:DUF3653 domain-containing protein [Stenotrophomonas sp. GbtcB23]|uniref:DUF3653 domain-containing protein n=1 Tax=Stenotrophomonas sp. GbtcB23 TaxID=2824768 RepID=UPI001C2F5051|nr:DUF3653 domain-containing protein [Stenotrophomonas sp. GbtcB23]